MAPHEGNTTVHTISNNLPSVNASDNTWTLDNSNTWTWLSERDPSGHQYLLWCRKGSDEYHAYCFISRKEFGLVSYS